VTIAVAISFDSGILLCADAQAGLPARIPRESTNIFTKAYGSRPNGARSIVAVSEPLDGAVAAALHACEHALGSLQPAEYTIDRMRATIENSLLEQSIPGAAFLVGLHSPIDRQCSLVRAGRTGLTEVVGYDCQGTAAHIGHYLIRDRYRGAQSTDSLDLTTVFTIATETVDGVRECVDGCGASIEIIVMYANGRASDVQRLGRDTQHERTLSLLGHLSRS
jgi:hypothetical protein